MLVPLSSTRTPLSMLVFSALVALSACCGILLFLFVYHRLKQLPLWRIPGPPSGSFLGGNFGQIFHADAWAFHDSILKTYGNVIRINGILGDTKIMISDPRACTSILLKEQDVFEESPWFLESNRHVFGSSLLSTMGPHHRKQRKMLNPVFSIKHMRSMIPLFQNITRQLEDSLQRKVADGPAEIDVMDWLGRLALELIAQGGMGYTFQSLEGKDNAFAKAIKEYTPNFSKIFVYRMLFPYVSKLPGKVLKFGATFIPWKNLHNVMGIVGIMHLNARQIFDEKKALLARGDVDTVHQIGEGKDIISVLLKENMTASEEDRLPDEEILAQMTTFLFAGTDTTSSALARIVHVLSEHRDVQEKLRKEIVEAYTTVGDGLGYDDLVSLPYLDAVCRESLRVYPPVKFITRVCRKDISIPLAQPMQTSAGYQSTIYVPSGTEIIINIAGINRSQAIWGEDAEEWKPERWLSPLPQTVEEARVPGVYSNTLTFLGGSRACIGFKFSQLEMKVALSQLIRSFRFSPSKTEIIWRFGTIATPSVAGSTSVGPKLPMVVERV